VNKKMALFSDEQKKIALLLLNEPKTEEELNKQLNIPYDKLTQELKTMLKLGLIQKQGYPTRYCLRQDIIDKIQERKKIGEKDAFKIRLRGIIEFKAIEQTLLKKHVKKIVEAIQKEKEFTVYGIEEAEIIEEDELYSTFIEVNLSVKNFLSIIRFLFYYGPTSIEVIKPSKIEINQFEFQEGLIELSEIFQKYAAFFTEHLNQEELEKFYKQAYK
jgi:hypothetical protein